ncbi:MAG: alpha/beta hydrolase fold domain-containing protein [Nannocystales bacterium]
MATAPNEVHPQLREAWTRAPKLPYHKLQRLPLMRRAASAMAKHVPTEGVTVETAQFEGVVLRVYRPAGVAVRAGLLWMHGGGLLLGSPLQDDVRCSAWAQDLGIVVASVHYRLAPEHPCPAASDDCLTGWRWLASLGLERMAVGGVSAGGGLAAVLCQRLRGGALPQPDGQLLCWPMLDDRTAADDSIDPTSHVVWNNRSNAAAWGAYLGCAPGAAVIPEYAAAARCEDVTGLPPTWIGVGTLDLFAAESRSYAARLHQASGVVQLDEVLGAFHDFVTLAPEAEVSGACRERQVGFLRRVLT